MTSHGAAKLINKNRPSACTDPLVNKFFRLIFLPIGDDTTSGSWHRRGLVRRKTEDSHHYFYVFRYFHWSSFHEAQQFWVEILQGLGVAQAAVTKRWL